MARTIADIPEAPFQTGIITEIKGGAFQMDDGWWLGIPEGSTPKEQDRYALWGAFGHTIRGVAFNDQVVYYRTQEEQDAKNQEEIEATNAIKKAKFFENEEDYRKRIAALPEEFQARFKRFQEGNPDFDWEYGGYELFVCEEAVVIANGFETAEAIQTWANLPWEEQKELMPDVKLEEHSGNTFGAAVAIAQHYKQDKKRVPILHGALTPLVGCEAYGCTHAK